MSSDLNYKPFIIIGPVVDKDRLSELNIEYGGKYE